MQTGPFAVGTRVRIQGSSNDPMAIGGKVGRIATLIPGGAMVKLDDREEKVNVRDASMTLEKGVNAEITDANGELLKLVGGPNHAFHPRPTPRRQPRGRAAATGPLGFRRWHRGRSGRWRRDVRPCARPCARAAGCHLSETKAVVCGTENREYGIPHRAMGAQRGEPTQGGADLHR